MNIATVMEFIESMVKSATASTGDQAYGSGMAGNAFDPIAFVKKPQVILRVITIVFSIILFGSIMSEDQYQAGNCPINDDSHACGFGITMGVVGFFLCVLFLVIDFRFDSFSNVKTRRRAVIADMGLSGLWAFMMFVTFIYLWSQWSNTSDDIKSKAGVAQINMSIAFSFFSLVTWAMICLLNYLRYRQGVSTTFSETYDETLENNDPNGMNGTGQAPFNQGGDQGGNMGAGGYQQQPNDY